MQNHAYRFSGLATDYESTRQFADDCRLKRVRAQESCCSEDSVSAVLDLRLDSIAMRAHARAGSQKR